MRRGLTWILGLSVLALAVARAVPRSWVNMTFTADNVTEAIFEDGAAPVSIPLGTSLGTGTYSLAKPLHDVISVPRIRSIRTR